jgi:hypothetical protein
VDPNYDAVKKVAPAISIQPAHLMTDSEFEKIFEATKVGPSSFDPKYTLVERRPDFGV